MNHACLRFQAADDHVSQACASPPKVNTDRATNGIVVYKCSDIDTLGFEFRTQKEISLDHVSNDA